MEVIQFALLGLGVGGAYAIEALGIVLVFRASRVVNFAQTGLVAIGAYIFYWFTEQGVSAPLAALLGIIASGVVGALIYLLVLRPLRAATDLVRLVGVLGVLLIITNTINLAAGTDPKIAPNLLPSTQWHFGKTVSIGSDRAYVLLISIAVAAVLIALSRWTKFGVRTRAVAESEVTFRSLGYSADKVSIINWSIGGALGGFAGILLASTTGLSLAQFTALLLPALAACLVARFESITTTLVAALLIGVINAEVTRYFPTSGLSEVVPLVLVIGVLLSRGKGLPGRDSITARLPAAGNGALHPVITFPMIIACCVLIGILPVVWATSVTTTAATGLIFMSVVVVTGYAGQVSLGQFGIAGCAALLAGKFSGEAGLPILLTLPIVVLIVVPVGLVLGVPAFRTRGMNLAIATLGLAEVVNSAILLNPSVTNGAAGTTTKSPELFGYSVDPIFYPNRYANFAFIVFVVGALVIVAFRRSHIARRWLAVRANERAAASLGVSVVMTKASALCLGAALAGAGGVLFAFSGPIVSFTGYDTTASINAVVLTMIGGIGYLIGATNGALIASGGVLTLVVSQYLGWSYDVVGLVSGILVVVNVITAPSGAVHNVVQRLARLRRKSALGVPSLIVTGEEPRETLARGRLSVDDVSISFGGIEALRGVSLEVARGQIVGLIGPNGAGKTTLIDIISGFTGGHSGTISLDGTSVNGRSPTFRARAGLARAFQSIEMFEDLSLFDNIRVGAESRSGVASTGTRWRPVRSKRSLELVAPGPCADAIGSFGLADQLSRLPAELSYGQRRLASIARALASGPRFILLDEPAAGLSQRERIDLEQFLQRLTSQHGLGVLLIEHDVPLVLAVCDRVIALNFGAVIAAGRPDDVRQDAKVIESYIGRAIDDAVHETGSKELSHAVNPDARLEGIDVEGVGGRG